MAREARKRAAPREIIFIAENEPQEVKLVRPQEQGGYGLDALWNDDFHHAAIVALTGHNEAYYTDYRGTPQEFISSIKYGYIYQGQRYKWQKKRRGTPRIEVTTHHGHVRPKPRSNCHSAYGKRLHALCAPGKLRAITALMLLAPGTPMLFQGQEFGDRVLSFSSPITPRNSTNKSAGAALSSWLSFLAWGPGNAGTFCRPR